MEKRISWRPQVNIPGGAGAALDRAALESTHGSHMLRVHGVRAGSYVWSNSDSGRIFSYLSTTAGSNFI